MTRYLGPKTDPANVATQADKLSLSSETPDALTPDQTGAAGTAITAARSDHQHEILAGAAGTITGTNAEGSSTSFARADHNHAYGNGSIPQAALALGPTYETSLPGSPVDGQEIYYAADAANGVIWHLRYRSGGGTYKWEFVGGSPLRAADGTARTVTNKTTYTHSDLTSPLIVSIPLAGEYEVVHIANLQVASGAGNRVRSAFAITDSGGAIQTEAQDPECLDLINVGSDTLGASLTASNLFTITTAGWKVQERIRTDGNFSGTTLRRRVFVRPIRVG